MIFLSVLNSNLVVLLANVFACVLLVILTIALFLLLSFFAAILEYKQSMMDINVETYKLKELGQKSTETEVREENHGIE